MFLPYNCGCFLLFCFRRALNWLCDLPCDLLLFEPSRKGQWPDPLLTASPPGAYKRQIPDKHSKTPLFCVLVEILIRSRQKNSLSNSLCDLYTKKNLISLMLSTVDSSRKFSGGISPSWISLTFFHFSFSFTCWDVLCTYSDFKLGDKLWTRMCRCY